MQVTKIEEYILENNTIHPELDAIQQLWIIIFFNLNSVLIDDKKEGNANFFSLNVVTIPNISIGDNNVIAPNIVIENNIKSDSTFFHRFKEVVLVIPKD